MEDKGDIHILPNLDECFDQRHGHSRRPTAIGEGKGQTVKQGCETGARRTAGLYTTALLERITAGTEHLEDTDQGARERATRNELLPVSSFFGFHFCG